jgi:hypothetical protein
MPEALDGCGSAGEHVLVPGGRAPTLQVESSFGAPSHAFASVASAMPISISTPVTVIDVRALPVQNRR